MSIPHTSPPPPKLRMESVHGAGRFAVAVVLAASFLVFLVSALAERNALLDDTYITLRYANHLAEGRGLVWNIGGERVEGFTSMLHVVLLAGAIRAGVAPETAATVIAVLAALGTAFLLIVVARRQFGLLAPPAALIVGLYLADRTTVGLTSIALETQLFVFLLCLCYLLAISFVEEPVLGKGIALAIATFASVLCRPDGAIYGAGIYAVLGIYLIAAARRHETVPGHVKAYLSPVVLLAGLGLAYGLAKYQYFGYLLPNPFYVKSNQVSLAGAGFVLRYLEHIAVRLGPLVAVLGLFVSAGSVKAIFRNPRTTVKVALTLVPPALALAYYTTITHEVGGSHRFSYPTYFYLVIAAAAVATLAFKRLPDLNRTRLAAFAAMAVAILFATDGNWRSLLQGGAARPPDAFSEYHFQIARTLEATHLGPRMTILCDAAGIIPFVTEVNLLDRVGLNDNFLSGRRPISPEQREQYIWSRNLDVYIGFEPPASPGAARAEDDPRMKTGYLNHLMQFYRTGGVVIIENRTFFTRPELWHTRMRELRDNWVWLGEINWPGWRISGLKSFAYVRRNSPHFDTLTPALKRLVVVKPERVDLNRKPSSL